MKSALKRIETALNDGESDFLSRTSTLFGGVVSETESILRRAKRRGEIPQDFVLPGRKRYLALFEDFLYGVYSAGAVIATEELQAKRSSDMAKFDDDDYMPSVIAVTEDAVIPKRAVKWLDEWTEVFGNDYYDDLTDDAVTVMKNGLEMGYSVPDVMKALDVVFQGEGFGKSRLEVIARTNATTAMNQGRLDTFRANGDFVKAVQYLAILDSRTTDICESRNGKIMRLDDPAVQSNTPPLHYRCRSILSPITAIEWEEMQGSELSDAMDWSKVDKPQKGFGNVEKALREKVEKRSLKEVSKKSSKEVKERGDIVSIGLKQPDRNDIEKTLRRIGFNEDEVGSVLARGSMEEVENSAITLMERRFREKFTELPEYSHLADKWNVDKVIFAELPNNTQGYYLPSDRIIRISNRYKEDMLVNLGLKKNLNSSELYGLYTTLHESIHSINNREYVDVLDYILEETITGSLSREYFGDYLRINGFKIPGDLEFQLGSYGYSTNYNSLKTLVEPLVKNEIASDFSEYCLSLKMEQSWRSRTEMLKGSYREYIANRLNRSLIDLPQEAESLLNLFDSEGLYSTSEGVIMFMDRLKELIGA